MQTSAPCPNPSLPYSLCPALRRNITLKLIASQNHKKKTLSRVRPPRTGTERSYCDRKTQPEVMFSSTSNGWRHACFNGGAVSPAPGRSAVASDAEITSALVPGHRCISVRPTGPWLSSAGRGTPGSAPPWTGCQQSGRICRPAPSTAADSVLETHCLRHHVK